LTVEYSVDINGTPETIKYKPDDLTAGNVFNQYAQVRGSVGLDSGAFQEQERSMKTEIDPETGLEVEVSVGQIGELVGEQRNDVRDRLTRLIASMKRGRKINSLPGSGAIVTFNSTTLSGTGNLSDDLFYLGIDNVKGVNPLTVNEPFKVIITGDVDMEVNGNKKTIIVEGGDIYVDQNVIGSLGIVALEDFAIKNKDGRFGGNVYICASVTETHIDFNIDGSLYSYGSSSTARDPGSCDKVTTIDAVTGLPSFDTLADEKDILSNQYTNYGAIKSANTYGGFTLVPPVTGYGELVTGTDDTRVNLRNQAKYQDLNFLRWARLMPYWADESRWCWDAYIISEIRGIEVGTPDQGKFSPSLGTGCYDSENPNAPPETGIVNFYFEDHSSLPIFKELALGL